MISPARNYSENVSNKDLADERYPDILFGTTYAHFLKSMKNVSPKTKKAYSKRLAEFLMDHQSTSEGFYAWILENHDQNDPRDSDALENLLTTYYNHLLVRPVKPYKFSTVIAYVKSVNHYLKGNDKAFSYSFRATGLSREEYNKKVLPQGQDRANREDIKDLMSITTNPQYHAMMMILKDTGLRSGDVAAIKYKHVREALQDNPPDYITFEFMPEKNMGQSDLPANPVLGPDAIKYLRLWIDHKKYLYENREAYEIKSKRKGRFSGVPRPHIYTEDDEQSIWMITSTRAEFTDKDGRTSSAIKFGDKLKPNGVTQAIQNLIRPHRKTRFLKKSAHSFRKNHTTGLTAGLVPERWINKMQGRKGVGTQGIYQRPDPDELIEAYSKGYHKISLEKEDSHEIANMRKQLDALQRMFDKVSDV